jgi:hypothetical protein
MANKQRLFTRVLCRKAINQQHKQDISALPLLASRRTYYSNHAVALLGEALEIIRI